MMPSDSYRLYEVQRAKNATEIRRADEQAAWLAAAVTRLVRGITRPARSARPPQPPRAARPTPRSRPVIARIVVSHATEPTGRRAG